MKRLLLVEDDSSLGATLQERLVKEGYQVDWAEDKQSAQSFCQDQQYDLILLDVGLPDGTGFEFATEVKQLSSTPFIFVTAMADAEFRLQGYELGAEEYIPKPFHLKELLLRVARVLEKNQSESNAQYQINAARINLGEMSIQSAEGEQHFLSNRDFQVLKLLIDRYPAVVSRDDILNIAWQSEGYPSNRSVDNCIVRLRQMLGQPQDEVIRTVRGVGYQLMQCQAI